MLWKTLKMMKKLMKISWSNFRKIFKYRNCKWIKVWYWRLKIIVRTWRKRGYSLTQGPTKAASKTELKDMRGGVVGSMKVSCIRIKSRRQLKPKISWSSSFLTVMSRRKTIERTCWPTYIYNLAVQLVIIRKLANATCFYLPARLLAKEARKKQSSISLKRRKWWRKTGRSSLKMCSPIKIQFVRTRRLSSRT